jgi:AcrR family transcriptional regulator
MRSTDERAQTFTRAARRAQIVGCAIEVIAEVGWAQASIRKIADRVGVAMSAVLYHFGTKDNLVAAIIEEMYRAALAVVVPALDAEVTASGKLTAYIRASVGYFDTHRVHLAVLNQLAAGYRPGDGRPLEQLELSPELGTELVALDPAAILLAGQRDGEFGEFPVDSVALALRGAVNAVVEKILHDPEFDAPGYGEDLAEFFGRAIRSTP